jgi:hypothetical protein
MSNRFVVESLVVAEKYISCLLESLSCDCVSIFTLALPRLTDIANQKLDDDK